MDQKAVTPACRTVAGDYRRLLFGSLAALAGGAVMIGVCYAFVDRPLATWLHAHPPARPALWKELTQPPPILQAWAPLIIALLALRRVLGPLEQWQRALLAGGVSLIVADQFRESLSPIFGRYWPDTWIDNNPSWIRNGAYGFHFFTSGSAYGSFPSGHTARMASLAAVLWAWRPRLGAIGLAAVLATAAGLLALNYHFLSDILAGGLLGALVGAWGAQLALHDASCPREVNNASPGNHRS